jgi:hypothetical protein
MNDLLEMTKMMNFGAYFLFGGMLNGNALFDLLKGNNILIISRMDAIT